MTSLDEKAIVEWERAYRAADTPEKRGWIIEEAERRGQKEEALCGLMRSTYAEATS